jgi:hypothetical protein
MVLVAPHLAMAILAPTVLDERAVVDLGRLALSSCTTGLSVPWDQPPLLFVLSGLIQWATQPLGVGPSLDLPILAIRLLFAASTAVPWLLFRRSVPPGVGRTLLFITCLIAPATLLWSGLAMVHGLAGVAVLVAIAGLAAPEDAPGPGRRTAILSLVAAVGTSYATWPAVAAIGLCVVVRKGLRDRLVCFVPAAVLGLGWLMISATQMAWVSARMAMSQPGSSMIAVDVWHTFSSLVSGTSDGLPVAVGVTLALAVLGTVAGPLERDLRSLLAAVVWGSWPILFALAPIVWMGRGKFLFLMHWPLAVLACAGVARIAQGKRLHAAVAVTALAVLAAGAVRLVPTILMRDDITSLQHEPLRWRCSDPWRTSHELLEDGARPLLRRASARAGGAVDGRARDR